MSEARLSEQAEADLDELWAYIAANHPDAADRMVDAVLDGCRMHDRFPNIGQSRDELRPGLRCFVVLGTPPSPPPPDVEPLDPAVRGATTIREQLEKHRYPWHQILHREITLPRPVRRSGDHDGRGRVR